MNPLPPDIDAAVAALPDPVARDDAQILIEMMATATGAAARSTGPATIGFGTNHYRYDSGREGDYPPVGLRLRPRQNTIYLMSGMVGYEDLLDRLGTFRTGKSCLYLRRLADVDRDVLRQILERCVRHLDQVEASRGAIPRMSEMPPFDPG